MASAKRKSSLRLAPSATSTTTKPPAATHEDFTAFLASIDLDTGIQPLTANQREQLFELFRNAKPVAALTALGPEIAYDPNHGTEAKS